MWISISEASRNWGISRTTIHAKIKQKILSKGENGLLDPAEISRVFGSPKIKAKNLHNVQNKENTLNSTLKELFEKQLDYERKLREQAEKRADEYQEKLTQAENALMKFCSKWTIWPIPSNFYKHHHEKSFWGFFKF